VRAVRDWLVIEFLAGAVYTPGPLLQSDRP